MVSVSMTLVTPDADFKVAVFFEFKLKLNFNMKSHTIYRTVAVLVTLNDP